MFCAVEQSEHEGFCCLHGITDLLREFGRTRIEQVLEQKFLGFLYSKIKMFYKRIYIISATCTPERAHARMRVHMPVIWIEQ